MSNQYKRKKFFIQKDFQGRLILHYFLFAVAGYLLFALLLAFFSADTITINYENQRMQLGNTPFILINKIVAANWILLIFGGALLVFIAIRLTHRVAGPQFKIEETLQSMRQGDLTNTIYLRKKDESQELAKNINLFNQQLSENITEIKERNQLIATQLTYLQAESDLKHNQQLDEIQNVISEQNLKIAAICTSFTSKK